MGPDLVPARPILQQATLPMHLERLLENLALEMDAFALCRVASGWRLRLPALDWVTFHFVVRGEGQARDASSEPRALAPGSLLVVPPRLVHTLQCGPPPHAEAGAEGRTPSETRLTEYLAGPDEEAGMLVVCGRAQVLYGGGVGVFDHLHESLAMNFADEPKMGALFEAMLAEIRSPRPGTQALVSALMDGFLVHVFRRLGIDHGAHVPWLEALAAPELEPALNAMLETPGHPHTVATLADLCHMSRSNFARRFKTSVGRPPMEYLRTIRLRYGCSARRPRPRWRPWPGESGSRAEASFPGPSRRSSGSRQAASGCSRHHSGRSAMATSRRRSHDGGSMAVGRGVTDRRRNDCPDFSRPAAPPATTSPAPGSPVRRSPA